MDNNFSGTKHDFLKNLPFLYLSLPSIEMMCQLIILNCSLLAASCAHSYLTEALEGQVKVSSSWVLIVFIKLWLIFQS